MNRCYSVFITHKPGTKSSPEGFESANIKRESSADRIPLKPSLVTKIPPVSTSIVAVLDGPES